MLPETEATTALLGMNAGTLLAEIREFWAELEVLARPVSEPGTPPPVQSRSGAQAMSSSGLNLQVTGGSANIAISTGEHSAALAGTGNTAPVVHIGGVDLSALLQELAQAISELPSPKARDTLAAHAEAAQTEARMKDKADPGLIKRALDAIKPAAAVLEGGEKIVSLCNKAYQALAPFLGLPPSPLP